MRSTIPPTEKKVYVGLELTEERKSYKIGGFNYFGYDNASYCATCAEIRPKETIRCPVCHYLVRHRRH